MIPWMTRERRIALAVGVITVVLTLLILALLEQREASSKVSYDCVEPTERERIRDIALRGIDDGLQKATALIYDIWRLDITPEPVKAQIGITNAINAHGRARKYTLAWMPPTCPP
jgi:hypothetical protein